MRSILRPAALLAFLLVPLAGCGLLPEQGDPTEDWSASKLYSEAKEALDDGDYQQAIDYFETLEARYPFGRFAKQAQLEIAYAYYKFGESESAISAAERFIKLHPQHPHVAYAYYLKGLANFQRVEPGFVERWFGTNPVKRDPETLDAEPLRQAFEDFATLVQRFPDSAYADDARQRMVFLRDELAQHELYVAEFYMERGAYLAAANRARYVVEHYQKSNATPKALAMMVRAYRQLEMDDLADDAQRVLRQSYGSAEAS